ncbi:hypothetical protein [Cytobacillus horneckiae]
MKNDRANPHSTFFKQLIFSEKNASQVLSLNELKGWLETEYQILTGVISNWQKK